nr:hypothetical protein [Sphingomonas sp. Y57]
MVLGLGLSATGIVLFTWTMLQLAVLALPVGAVIIAGAAVASLSPRADHLGDH